MALCGRLGPTGSGILWYYSPIRGIPEGQNREILLVSTTLVYLIGLVWKNRGPSSTMIHGKWLMSWPDGQGLGRDKIAERGAYGRGMWLDSQNHHKHAVSYESTHQKFLKTLEGGTLRNRWTSWPPCGCQWVSFPGHPVLAQWAHWQSSYGCHLMVGR